MSMWNNNGGDFNQSGFGGQGGGFQTPQGEEKKRGGKRNNNIVPVTVAQILTARNEDDVYISGSLEIHQVTLIGLIRSVNETSSRIDYEIDDMTGPPIEARFFIETDEDTNETTQREVLPVNTYVRVNGLVRAFAGKRSINCHKITPITDMNELSCHMLECIFANATSAQVSQTSVRKNENPMDTDDNGMPTGGLSPMQAKVQAIIKREGRGETGCSIDEICQHLKSVAPKAIRDACEFLSIEGLIYSTIDDEHFQATDM